MNNPDMGTEKTREILIAENVRKACAEVVKESFNEALLSGLCSDGAAEVAIGALQALDIQKIIRETDKDRAN